MPWLMKDQSDPSDNLFFVHVPCAGHQSDEIARRPRQSDGGRII